MLSFILVCSLRCIELSSDPAQRLSSLISHGDLLARSYQMRARLHSNILNDWDMLFFDSSVNAAPAELASIGIV